MTTVYVLVLLHHSWAVLILMSNYIRNPLASGKKFQQCNCLMQKGKKAAGNPLPPHPTTTAVVDPLQCVF